MKKSLAEQIKMALRQVAEQIHNIEPDGIYFPVLQNMNVQIFDRESFRSRDVVVAVNHDSSIPNTDIENEVSKAFTGARSVSFVHGNVSVN